MKENIKPSDVEEKPSVYESVLSDIRDLAPAEAIVNSDFSHLQFKIPSEEASPANDIDINELLHSELSKGEKTRWEIVQLIEKHVGYILDAHNYMEDVPENINPKEHWIPYVTRKTENPVQFLRRVYEEWLNNGLTLADVRKADPKFYVALNNWLSKNKLPRDIYLPKKYDVHNASSISESDVESYRKVLAYKKRETRRRQ